MVEFVLTGFAWAGYGQADFVGVDSEFGMAAHLSGLS